MAIRDKWQAPFSLTAAVATACIGSHFIERALKADEEWASTAFWIMANVMGMITVMETLQVWQSVGLIKNVPTTRTD